MHSTVLMLPPAVGFPRLGSSRHCCAQYNIAQSYTLPQNTPHFYPRPIWVLKHYASSWEH